MESISQNSDNFKSTVQSEIERYHSQKGWGHHLLVAMSGATAASGFIMDMNKTHMFNPRWTPHSKFHDALTIMNGALLGSAGLYFLLSRQRDEKLAVALGALLPGIFWTSLIGAFAFPGAKGMDSEFPDKVPRIGGMRINEAAAAGLNLAILGLGFYYARKKS